MQIKRVVVISNDGVSFTVEVFGRTDAQVQAAWEQECRYAASKPAVDLINHGDFTLRGNSRVDDPAPDFGARQPQLRPPLRLIQGGRQ